MLALVVGAVVYPTFRAPDERAHVDMALALSERLTRPVIDRRLLSEQVAAAGEAVGLDGAPADLPPLEAGAAPPRGARPSFAELAEDRPTPLRNQMTQHPPAYYLLAGAVVRMTGDGTPFDRQVLALRLLSAALVAPLPVLFFLTARAAGVEPHGALAAAAVPLAIPMLTHIGSSVNNDNLLVLCLAVLAVLLVRVVEHGGGWGTAAGVGVVSGLALLTKGFALVVPVWATAAYAVTFATGRRARTLGHWLLATALAAAAGGWWWLRNLVEEGELQPHHASLPTPAPGFEPDAGWWIGFAALRLVRRFWIEPDLVQRVPPAELVLTTLLAAAVVAGVGVAQRRGRLPHVLVLLVPLTGLLAMVLLGAWDLYVRSGAPFGLHGRYLFPGMSGVAVALAFAADAAGRLRLWAPAVVVGAALVLQVLAGVAALRFYWDGPAALAAWSPLHPGLIVAAGLGALAALVAAAVLATTGGPGRPTPSPTDAG